MLETFALLADDNRDAPWSYNIEDPACARPLGLRLVHVDHIRFTQRQVNDSFSHNRRPIMELVEGLLAQAICHREVPLIRVAWKDGAFWSIDNRRLFCYKHCKLGRICVEVCDWATDLEFDMKFRGGEAARHSAQGGHQAGLVQRLTDRPFPKSDVINLAESNILLYMDDDSQLWHDAQREQLTLARQKENNFEYQLFADAGSTWKYEIRLVDGWFPAAVMEASKDGSFKVCACREQIPFAYPGALPNQLRIVEDSLTLSLLPPVPKCFATFIVPQGMRSSLTQAWCALCGKVVGDGSRHHALRDHERQEHKAREHFQCSTCGEPFSCSDDLRRHSRTKVHEIPEAFSHSLGGLSLVQNAEAPDASEDVRSVFQQSTKLGNRRVQKSVNMDCGDEDTFIVVKGESDHFPTSVRASCAICLTTFETEKMLKVHEQSNHNKNEFSCSTCSRPFVNSTDLRKHSRSTSHSIAIRFLPCKREHVEPIVERSEAMLLSSSLGENVVNCSRKTSAGDREIAELSQDAVPDSPAPPNSMQHIFWLHAESGQRLEERCVHRAVASEQLAPRLPTLGDFVLERYKDPESMREYLWCPATRNMFFIDTAAESGWQKEVWQKMK